MTGEEALEQLPRAYALALRLRCHGVGMDLIAECLGVEARAVPALLALAEAKLTALLDGGDGGGATDRASGHIDQKRRRG